MSLARAAYRARQFLGGLAPRISPEARATVAAYLGPHQRLFSAMARRDQRHCLDVFQRLRCAGCEDHHLLAAALLHDVGKGEVSLWQRAAYVMLAAHSLRLVARLARPGGRGWRGALAALGDHPQRGAALAAAAGLPPATVRLIRQHEEPAERGEPALGPLLLRLREADDSS